MPINEEYIFTYEDYLAIMHDGFISVHENDTKYKTEETLEENKKHQKHDKSFKDALSDKKEMAFFLNEFVGIKVKENELQHYKSEFITKQYDKREADIVYKNTEKEIYYIVEHQSRKDKNMPYRMVEYCIELMKDVVKNSNSKFYPVIVPIVLYTGEGEWNIETNFAKRKKESFSEDVIKKLKEKKKEGEYYMETMLVKRMKREAKENIAKGILQNLTATIKNMLKYNEDDETIMKYTNAKKEDIDRVRKELNM